jgi:hypothetical protein
MLFRCLFRVRYPVTAVHATIFFFPLFFFVLFVPSPLFVPFLHFLSIFPLAVLNHKFAWNAPHFRLLETYAGHSGVAMKICGHAVLLDVLINPFFLVNPLWDSGNDIVFEVPTTMTM